MALLQVLDTHYLLKFSSSLFSGFFSFEQDFFFAQTVVCQFKGYKNMQELNKRTLSYLCFNKATCFYICFQTVLPEFCTVSMSLYRNRRELSRLGKFFFFSFVSYGSTSAKKLLSDKILFMCKCAWESQYSFCYQKSKVLLSDGQRIPEYVDFNSDLSRASCVLPGQYT